MSRRPRLSQAAKRRRQRRLWLASAYVAVVVLVIGGLSYLSYRDSVLIQSVTVTGNEIIETERVVGTVNEVLDDSHWLWLFNRDNVLWYPRTKIQDRLRQEFPRIEQLAVSTGGFQALEVRIKERQPYGVWCQSPATPEQSADQTADCWLLDRGGFLFGQAAATTSDGYLAFLDQTATTSSRAVVGSRYLPERFPRLADFIDGLGGLGFRPERVVRTTDTTAQIELTDGRYILLDTTADLRRSLDNLRVLLDSQPAAAAGGEFSDFVYIDLRFGNRVFYKPRSAVSSTGTATTTGGDQSATEL